MPIAFGSPEFLCNDFSLFHYMLKLVMVALLLFLSCRSLFAPLAQERVKSFQTIAGNVLERGVSVSGRRSK